MTPGFFARQPQSAENQAFERQEKCSFSPPPAKALKHTAGARKQYALRVCPSAFFRPQNPAPCLGLLNSYGSAKSKPARKTHAGNTGREASRFALQTLSEGQARRFKNQTGPLASACQAELKTMTILIIHCSLSSTLSAENWNCQ